MFCEFCLSTQIFQSIAFKCSYVKHLNLCFPHINFLLEKNIKFKLIV